MKVITSDYLDALADRLDRLAEDYDVEPTEAYVVVSQTADDLRTAARLAREASRGES